MYFLSISTITNMLENAEILLLGFALFVMIVAIGVMIALSRSILRVNNLIKRILSKRTVGVILKNDSIPNENKENILLSGGKSESNELIDNNEIVVDKEDSEIEYTTEELDDDIIEDEDRAFEETIEDIEDKSINSADLNESTNNEDDIIEFTEPIDDTIIDDSEIVSLEETFIDLNISNSIDGEVITNTVEPTVDINETVELLENKDNTVNRFIDPTDDEGDESEAPISFMENERPPVFIQPNDEGIFDEPIPIVSYETPMDPEFIRSEKANYDAPKSLEVPKQYDEIPLFSESSYINTDEVAPESFKKSNEIPSFNYSSQHLYLAPEKLEEARIKEPKVKNESIVPEFSRPISSPDLDRPDTLIHGKIEEIPPAEFIKSESSDSAEPPKFDSEYSEYDIEPPEFNYSASRLDDIPQSFDEIAKDIIPETVDSEEPVFVVPIKPPPKGLYDEVPDNSEKVNIEIEEPKIAIPEGLTEDEKRLIAEQQALLDMLSEESLSEEAENYDIVGICTDTSAFTAFENKLHNATNRIKYYYSELKNTLLSYKGIKSKLTNAGDSFKVGGSIVARITLNGNKLRLHLSLDPSEYNKSIYNHYSLADVKAYKEIPLALEIAKRADLSTASKLIQDAMGSKLVLYIDQKREYVDYAAYYTDKED